ncbi:MAG TPA: hypothetical protein VN767_08660 [Streptosporangiaceae bacterium]|nr:hypothetical protein [Streptosporangiaceae bacterium]
MAASSTPAASTTGAPIEARAGTGWDAFSNSSGQNSPPSRLAIQPGKQGRRRDRREREFTGPQQADPTQGDQPTRVG